MFYVIFFFSLLPLLFEVCGGGGERERKGSYFSGREESSVWVTKGSQHFSNDIMSSRSSLNPALLDIFFLLLQLSAIIKD